MCQTGVPFGEVKSVRDWMGIDESVEKPEVECPERRIKGFSCLRSEQSGMKFWGLFKELCGTPERFFKSAFVYNYCPLAFMDNKGKNITPNMIKVYWLLLLTYAFWLYIRRASITPLYITL